MPDRLAIASRPPLTACARVGPQACRVPPGLSGSRARLRLSGLAQHCMQRDVGEAIRGRSPPRHGPVAQWLEPAAHNGLVGGSSPPGPTNVFNLNVSRGCGCQLPFFLPIVMIFC
jgi:hypothetical protein